ncbi:TetR family transcriptional regulator [Actinomadura rupiterrae]|uniref:TetR family transcriptional regulator n=1 Tax=Actinomadura rupiterrae TaxID=559627 RepID=UPI0020A4591A|nr:TetR family transcriptional regulator [Actinomadura rupiterrae]MCP2341657.1 AcrR family transcriptional regulator [Actinomadura rupiterrae]
MTVEMGLRERKKAATRDALSRAAMRLAIQHGVEGVTVDAIAAAAGVSTRTFHNYFPGKEEAIVAPLTDGARALLARLAERPADEPVWDSVRTVLHEVLVPGERFEEMIALMRIVKADPALVASQLCGLGEMQREAAAVFAARTGTDPERDLYPHLVAGVTGMTMRVVVELWVDGRTDATLPELIDSALAQFRAGLPVPTASDQPGTVPSGTVPFGTISSGSKSSASEPSMAAGPAMEPSSAGPAAPAPAASGSSGTDSSGTESSASELSAAGSVAPGSSGGVSGAVGSADPSG